MPVCVWPSSQLRWPRPPAPTKSTQVCQPPVLLPTLFWASNPACHLCRLLGEGSAFTESLSHGPITLKRRAQFLLGVRSH